MHNRRKDHMLKYMPKAVYVKFDDAAWQLDGMPLDSHGVYAIVPRNEYWLLDGKRKHGACMKVRRRQLPISPDWARTAYSMQGFTLPAAKVDLNFSKNTDPVTGYVALSRVKKADDVLILQPFERVMKHACLFCFNLICCRNLSTEVLLNSRNYYRNI